MDDVLTEAVHQVAFRTGLKDATVADLLESGWTFVEGMSMVPRWEHPIRLLSRCSGGVSDV